MYTHNLIDSYGTNRKSKMNGVNALYAKPICTQSLDSIHTVFPFFDRDYIKVKHFLPTRLTLKH